MGKWASGEGDWIDGICGTSMAIWADFSDRASAGRKGSDIVNSESQRSEENLCWKKSLRADERKIIKRNPTKVSRQPPNEPLEKQMNLKKETGGLSLHNGQLQCANEGIKIR